MKLPPQSQTLQRRLLGGDHFARYSISVGRIRERNGRMKRGGIIWNHSMKHKLSLLIVTLILLWNQILSKEIITPTYYQDQFAFRGTKTIRILAVGNSYTYMTIPTGTLEQMLEQTPNNLLDKGDDAKIYLVAPGGYFLSQHGLDAVTPETELYQYIHHDPARFDYVILQEQSQMAGLWDLPAVPGNNETFDGGLEAAVKIDQMVAPAQTVFFMTWGRREHNLGVSKFYRDFPSMNARLETGYRKYVRQTSKNSTTDVVPRQSKMAPVGLAFAHVYYHVKSNKGQAPLDTSSLFFNLYSEDGSHPSPTGTYLTACVFFGTITGQDPRTVVHDPVIADEEGGVIDQQTIMLLRNIASETLHKEGLINTTTEGINETLVHMPPTPLQEVPVQ